MLLLARWIYALCKGVPNLKTYRNTASLRIACPWPFCKATK